MKKLFTLSVPMVIGIFLTASVFAQSPEKMSYQAVIRNANNSLVTEQTVGMQISILQGSASGTAVFIETQTPTTNANGLVSIEIGAGTVVSGNFTTIDWANGPYFIKTETDPGGGTNYTITGVNQLSSVPYAMHTKTAVTVTGTITESQISDLNHFTNSDETDPSVPAGTQAGEIQYWNGSEWITVEAGNEGEVLTFSGGVPTWSSTAGFNVVENPTTGKIWMDRNLGASQVATSSTDAAACGDLYQWGRAGDGHQLRTSGTTSTLSSSDTPGHGNFITNSTDWRSPQNDNLWQGVDGTNNPCPNGYRLPTGAEWEAERQSWGSNDAAGAFASPLKLTVAGYRSYSSGLLLNVGSIGSYWSSTVNGTYSRYLDLSSSNAFMSSYFRAYGRSVRCIKD